MIVTTPVLPSTLIISPVLITVVATPVPVTAGRPYSLETMAAWDVRPPISVTAAFILVNTGAHEGFVLGATKISPGCSLTTSSINLSTRAGPSTIPADDAKPLSSVMSLAATDVPFNHSATLSVVIPHSITVKGSETSSGGTPSPGTGAHFRAASSIFSRFSALAIQYLPWVGTPSPRAHEVATSSINMGTSNRKRWSSAYR